MRKTNSLYYTIPVKGLQSRRDFRDIQGITRRRQGIF